MRLSLTESCRIHQDTPKEPLLLVMGRNFQLDMSNMMKILRQNMFHSGKQQAKLRLMCSRNPEDKQNSMQNQLESSSQNYRKLETSSLENSWSRPDIRCRLHLQDQNKIQPGKLWESPQHQDIRIQLDTESMKSSLSKRTTPRMTQSMLQVRNWSRNNRNLFPY